MSALLAVGWSVVAFLAARRHRPVEWSRRPEVAAAMAVEPTRQSITARWGRAAQQKVPLLDELSSVVVGAALVAAVVLAFVDVTLTLVVAASIGLVAIVRRVGGQRRRAAALVRQTPAAVDLLRLCLSAGMTPRLAIERVAGLVPEPLQGELASVVTRTSRGESLAVALRRMAVRGHPLRPLALGVAAAEESGQALGPLFERQAGEARLALRRQAEERARRLPVTMLVPLVTCVLPAFVLIVVVPMVGSQLNRLL